METKQPKQKQWMSVSEVAGELEVSEWVIRRLVEDGDLPAKKIGRKPMIRIHREDFRQYRDQRDN